MANRSRPIGEAADKETMDLSGITLEDATQDVPIMLDLTLEEDIAANLDHFILLSRQGFFGDANDFFEACLKKHGSWFPVVWEYYNSQTIKDQQFDPKSDEFLIRARRSYMYDSEEMALLNLIINGVTSLNASLDRLRHLLLSEEIRDIDVCTATIFMAC